MSPGERDDAPEREARRLRRIRATHSYGAVLVAIVAGFVFAATAPDADWASSVLVLLQTGTLVLALWTAGWSVAEARIPFGLAAVGLGLGVANLLWSGTDLTAAVGIVAGLTTVTTILVIAGSAIQQTEVNVKSATAAVCVYVLLGMTFMFVYGVAAALGSGAFFAQGTDGTRAIRLYFSYVTLATLGYGDYTAAGNLGHLFAMLEALVGQLYLVTVVAVVVGRLSVSARARR